MTDKELEKIETGTFSEYRRWLVSEIGHVSDSISTINKNIDNLKVDIRTNEISHAKECNDRVEKIGVDMEVLKNLIADSSKQISESVQSHVSACDDTHNNIWSSISEVRKRLAVHTAKIQVWTGIGSFIIATVVSVGILVLKNWKS